MRDDHCMYCVENAHRDSLMIPVAELSASIVYLFRDQTYYGRCVVAAKNHYKELYDFPQEERIQFMEDVAKVAKAVATIGEAEKLNYGVFGDKVPHFHFHLVPKKEGVPGFGGMFEMNSEPPVYLSDAEYKELISRICQLIGK